MAKKFRGLGGRNFGGSSKKAGNISELLKQAQKAQEEMQKLEESFKTMEVTASVGGGAVHVTATCDYRIKSIEIAEDLKDEDFEVLQDLLIAGVNEALEEVGKKREEESGKISSMFNLPDKMF